MSPVSLNPWPLIVNVGREPSCLSQCLHVTNNTTRSLHCQGHWSYWSLVKLYAGLCFLSHLACPRLFWWSSSRSAKSRLYSPHESLFASTQASSAHTAALTPILVQSWPDDWAFWLWDSWVEALSSSLKPLAFDLHRHCLSLWPVGRLAECFQ